MTEPEQPRWDYDPQQFREEEITHVPFSLNQCLRCGALLADPPWELERHARWHKESGT